MAVGTIVIDTDRSMVLGKAFDAVPRDLQLAEERVNWPYEAGALLKILAEQAGTKDDPRLAELKRRERRH